MNIGKKYMGPRVTKAQWRDASVLVKGPAVADLQALFLDDWAYAGPPEPPETLPSYFPSTAGTTCRIAADAASGPTVPSTITTGVTAFRPRAPVSGSIPPTSPTRRSDGPAQRGPARRGRPSDRPGRLDLRIVSYAGRSYINELLGRGSGSLTGRRT
jgi:phosphatidylserine/phosphatidylglycerophosphate/cardiolipin synthase-like enzyme